MLRTCVAFLFRGQVTGPGVSGLRHLYHPKMLEHHEQQIEEYGPLTAGFNFQVWITSPMINPCLTPDNKIPTYSLEIRLGFRI